MFKKLWLTAIMALTSAQGFSEIIPVSTMQEVAKRMNSLEEKDFALFDIDMVLTQPKDPAFQMANMKRHSLICKKIIQQVPAEKRDIFLILTALGSDSILLDDQIPSMIQELQKRGVPSMALTGNFTGKFAHIDSMENWKIEDLHRHGIDFSQKAPHAEKIVFTDLSSYRNNYSVYVDGVLFVNGSTCSKGPALVSFLKKTGRLPKKVIFIDDKEDNLKSVETSLKEFNPSIQFVGLHFTGARDYPSIPLDEKEFEAKWQEIASKAIELE